MNIHNLSILKFQNIYYLTWAHITTVLKWQDYNAQKFVILSVFACILISNAKITSTIFACESIESISIDMQKLMKIHYETIKIINYYALLYS